MDRAAPIPPAAADRGTGATNTHPLQAFPPFRNLPSGPWHRLLYTLIFNSAIGTAFCLIAAMFSGRLPSGKAFLVYLAISNFIGYAIHALFALGKAAGIEAAARRSGVAGRLAYFSAIPTGGVIVGFWIASAVFNLGFSGWIRSPEWIVSVASTSVIISLILSAIFFWRERGAMAEAALQRESARVERMEREALLANLRALQAQIEPHFLFNTLANVTSLIDADPSRARHMLESFIRFLRASLAASRRSRAPLADEFALMGDFLEVLRVRMGERLRVRIDLPADLASIEIPPMLVQPLVENAIRHGIEPNVEGGLIEIRARREGERLRVEVADTGVGFADTTSGGVGLANVRERLRLAHGETARLSVRENAPRGTIVAIDIPLEGA